MSGNPYTYVKSSRLTSEECAVEERFGRLIEADLPSLIAAYRKKFGKIVSGDLARQLSPDYAAANNEGRGLLSRATYAPSRVLALGVFQAILDDTPRKLGAVSFTQGGPGSGKTTSVGRALSTAICDMVFDSTLTDLVQAKDLIDRSILAAKTAHVMLTQRPLEDAWQGVVQRAYHEEGRIVTLHDFYQKHVAARIVHGQLRAYYKDHPQVRFEKIDNGRERPLELLPSFEEFQPLADSIVNDAHHQKSSIGLSGKALADAERFRLAFFAGPRRQDDGGNAGQPRPKDR